MADDATPEATPEAPTPPEPPAWSKKKLTDAADEFDKKRNALTKAQSDYDAAVKSVDRCRSVLENAIAERDAAAQAINDAMKGA